jgi:protein-S-isoprenylcysteine O-methyltransferase Ste14
MGVSWRIGIDETNKTDLITNGLFSISRNPIFLGILVSILGLFLALPNALSFALLLAIYIVIQVQVRLEEEFLKRTNESGYSQYCSNVRRWI